MNNMEDLSNMMSNIAISDMQCPLCELALKCDNGIYMCNPDCYLGKYPSTKYIVIYLKEKIDKYRVIHRYEFI